VINARPQPLVLCADGPLKDILYCLVFLINGNGRIAVHTVLGLRDIAVV